MSSCELVIAPAKDARAVALNFSDDRWSCLQIDYYELALHELVAKLRKRSRKVIFKEIKDLTPKLPGADKAEPWDERFWVASVGQLSAAYVKALAGIQDSDLPEVANWLFATDQLRHERKFTSNITKKSVARDLRNIRDFLASAGKRTVLIRGST